jgi:hypothetical protein
MFRPLALLKRLTTWKHRRPKPALVKASDGSVWFTEECGNRLARVVL